jgi:hypothetical protein
MRHSSGLTPAPLRGVSKSERVFVTENHHM